jgi:hypothetical protein
MRFLLNNALAYPALETNTGLRLLVSHGMAGCILSEKLIIIGGGAGECSVVVLRLIKKLLVSGMSMVIILRVFLIKVRHPAQFTIHISIM